MTKTILLVVLLATIVPGTTLWASESEMGAAVSQASQINPLYGALLLVVLGDSQGMRARGALRQTRMDAGSNETSAATDETGLAAVYSASLAGHRTASGARYEPALLTAAHKLLPFGTRVRVTNANNGKTVELTITDRGPRQGGRVLDLSRAAARQLGIGAHGMAPVRLTVLNAESPKTTT